MFQLVLRAMNIEMEEKRFEIRDEWRETRNKRNEKRKARETRDTRNERHEKRATRETRDTRNEKHEESEEKLRPA